MESLFTTRDERLISTLVRMDVKNVGRLCTSRRSCRISKVEGAEWVLQAAQEAEYAPLVEMAVSSGDVEIASVQ